MKHLLTTITTLFIGLSFGQNSFYESQYLTSLSDGQLAMILKANSDQIISLSKFEEKQVGNYKEFLATPFKDFGTERLDIQALKSAINKFNSFIKSENESLYYGGGGHTSSFTAVAGVGTKIPSFISSIATGGVNLDADTQTKIIDGLTKYFAEEFRKAQMISYMEGFEKTIGKFGELELLFPETYKKLKSADPTRFPDLGDEIKEVFDKDLHSLLDNLINHFENHLVVMPTGGIITDYPILDPSTRLRYKVADIALDTRLKFLNSATVLSLKSKENYELFKMSADVSSKLINNYHPVDLFNFIDNKYYEASFINSKANKFEKAALMIHGLNLLQSNLLDTTKSVDGQFNNVWLGFEQLKEINTLQEWTYFMGLIYQQDPTYFKDLFNGLTVTISGTTTTLNASIPTTLATLNIEQIEAIQKIISPVLSALTELQDFRSTITDENIGENYGEYMKIVFSTIRQLNIQNEDFNKFFKIAEYTTNVYENTRDKDYGNSVHYSMLILDELLGANSTYSDLIGKIEKYAAFMEDVVEADDSDAVKEVIKKHVAPPASFILKRQRSFTMSVTGMPGYFAGVEQVEEEYKFTSGITLPIGVDFSFRVGKGSINAFAQLLDLGAVLNFRLDDSTSVLPDQITVKQIFSPGVSLSYGFPNSPITLGVGYQYTPELRLIDPEAGNGLYDNSNRFFIRMAWDIPLINIAKTKK